MTKPTCEQLIEQLGDKQDITICSDVVYGLGFEYSQLKKEIDKLTAESTHYESKYYIEAKKVDKAIDVLEELIAEFQLNNYITDFDKKMNKPLNILKGGDNK